MANDESIAMMKVETGTEPEAEMIDHLTTIEGGAIAPHQMLQTRDKGRIENMIIPEGDHMKGDRNLRNEQLVTSAELKGIEASTGHQHVDSYVLGCWLDLASLYCVKQDLSTFRR
jgi:hypothetical protein